MKKTVLFSAFLASIIIFSSCSKKEDPAPTTNATNNNSPTPTTPTNTASTTAPSLNTGTTATVNAVTGANNASALDLSTVITDPQGDNWTVTSVTSSNSAVATAAVAAGTTPKSVQYTGVAAGNAILTIVVTDAAGNTNTIYYTVTVAQDNNTTSTTAPSLNAGVPTVIDVTTGTNNAETLNLSTLITDPQSDVWTITSVTSSNPAVATVSIEPTEASQSIKYVGVAAGNTTLTIVVRDAAGNTNTITYSLTVAQAIVAPYLNAGVSTSLSVIAGANNVATLDLTNSVTEPQGEVWYIDSYTSSNPNIATVAIAPASDSKAINYTGVTAGTTTLTLVLRDLDNNRTTVTFNLTVLVNTNGPNLNSGVSTNLGIQNGSNTSWNLANNVTDPNGLPWTITGVTSSNTAIATAYIEGGSQSINYLGVGDGTAALSIVLTNSDGAQRTITANVTVYPKSGGGGGGPKVVVGGGGTLPK